MKIQYKKCVLLKLSLINVIFRNDIRFLVFEKKKLNISKVEKTLIQYCQNIRLQLY